MHALGPSSISAGISQLRRLRSQQVFHSCALRFASCLWGLQSQPEVRGKEESERAEVKLNTPIAKIMASGPIPSWQIDGGKVETVTDFIFLGYKIATDNEESHENKRCLLLGRKAMTNLDSLLKSRDITLPTKVSIVRALVSQ